MPKESEIQSVANLIDVLIIRTMCDLNISHKEAFNLIKAVLEEPSIAASPDLDVHAIYRIYARLER